MAGAASVKRNPDGQSWRNGLGKTLLEALSRLKEAA